MEYIGVIYCFYHVVIHTKPSNQIFQSVLLVPLEWSQQSHPKGKSFVKLIPEAIQVVSLEQEC